MTKMVWPQGSHIKRRLLYFNKFKCNFYLNKLPPDEPLGKTAVVVLLFYFVLTCSV